MKESDAEFYAAAREIAPAAVRRVLKLEAALMDIASDNHCKCGICDACVAKEALYGD